LLRSLVDENKTWRLTLLHRGILSRGLDAEHPPESPSLELHAHECGPMCRTIASSGRREQEPVPAPVSSGPLTPPLGSFCTLKLVSLVMFVKEIQGAVGP